MSKSTIKVLVTPLKVKKNNREGHTPNQFEKNQPILKLCDNCEIAISEERLKAIPQSKLCISCANELESERIKRKLYGK